MDLTRLTELRELMTRLASPDALAYRVLPNVTLMSAVAPTLPMADVTEPTFALVARGTKHVCLGDQVFDYSTGQYLIVSVDLPLEAHVAEATKEAPYLGLGLALRPEAIASLLLEVGSAPAPLSDPPGIAVSALTDELIEPIIRLLRLVDRPADIPVLANSIEREFLWRLINGAQGPMVRQIGLADSRMAQIGRAIRHIRTHYAEPLRIENLAQVAGMSVTSFHRHFLAVTSMTPIGYLKQIRLQTARSLLLASAEDVATVGFAVGYNSASQFSREYRRQFGEAPGRDGRRLRQTEDTRNSTD
ncbi:AraC family transcriptional regulator [Paraburkholderia susongensis]|uniref:Transcriptional regulator, AraC family n=1 Tax=Paraburkholderia susongensis TaxID=1515439 RepID=A0A1X7JFL8_9BURK|nr:AraC family transcriptional regulator [Paraburkholderia susongensis]SMG26835.1 transcriptional regulator, AraC family [Paraburkholderia susongensis]